MKCILLYYCVSQKGWWWLQHFRWLYIEKINNHVFIVFFFFSCDVLLVWSKLPSAAQRSGSVSGSGLSVIVIRGFQNPLWSEAFFRRRGRFPTLKRDHPGDFLRWVSSVISLMCQATLLQNKYSEMGREEGEKGGKNRLPSELLIWNMKHFIDTRKTQT